MGWAAGIEMTVATRRSPVQARRILLSALFVPLATAATLSAAGCASPTGSDRTDSAAVPTTTPEQPRDDRAEILRILHAYHDAMVEARTDQLDRLLDSDFSLVHISGYEQPKSEWFGVIQSGQFDYHRITIEERALSLNVTGSSAMVAGRGIFDATINGARKPWRLRFTMRFAKPSEGWVVAHARYTTF